MLLARASRQVQRDRRGQGPVSSRQKALGVTSKQGNVCGLALAPRLSENLLPCPHPTLRCLQGRTSSLSPQAQRVSPSCPHLALLTLDSSLSPEAQTPAPQVFLPWAGPPEPGPAPSLKFPLCVQGLAFGNCPTWGPPATSLPGWAHSGLDLHPMGSEPHSSGHGNPYCGSKALCAPTCRPPGHLSSSLAPPAFHPTGL